MLVRASAPAKVVCVEEATESAETTGVAAIDAGVVKATELPTASCDRSMIT